MSVSLRSTDPANLGAEPDGPTYRLGVDQYEAIRREGIIPDGDRVGLVDGFLRRADPSPDSGLYGLSVEQYHRIADAAILTRDDRVELLEGWLVAKMTKKPPHEIAKGLTQDLLMALIPAGWFLAVEGPANTADSEPEPDLMIVQGSRRDYHRRAPGPANVALVIEVSESSPSRDRSRKKRLYARAGFPTYWLINLIDGRVEVYTDPTGPVEGPDYRDRRDYGPEDLIPLVIEGPEYGRLAVRDLLP